MPFNRKTLMEFLGIVDEELDEPIELTAVGGTAMTLPNLKNSTMNIDFDLDGRHINEFRKKKEFP